MKATKASYLGIIVSMVTFTSLFLPWWSIRASGVSIDIYPFGVTVWSAATPDWVVDHLLALGDTVLIVGLLVVISGVLALLGSLKLPPLLISPVVLNLVAVFLFYGLLRSAIGRLAHGPFSGTNLIPVGPWGFAVGIGLCVFAGLASPAPFILYYLNSRKSERECRSGKSG